MRKEVFVIGGGAAGFFCAVNAARLNPDLHITILEKTNKLLSKVKISGGGRCNVTHALFDIPEMSKRYPRGNNFVKKIFHQFFTTDTIQWFAERGVVLKTEKDGRMFPVSDSSQSIISCLMTEVNRYGIDIRMNAEVKEIKVNPPLENNKQFQIQMGGGEKLEADFVCIACGGYPKASMFQWLENTGHSFAPPLPSLFTFNLPKHPITKLMGITVEHVRVKIEGSKLSEEGPLLITHWGMSGPAVLRLSAWGARELADRNYHFNIHLNWLPRFNEQSLKEEFKTWRLVLASKKISQQNFAELPNRLWHFLLEISGIGLSTRFADLTARNENALIKNMVDYVAEVKGKTTFKEEFVTAGGITVSEIDAATMMSKKIKNLFFAGEILDVDGITGGFNFQHAWSSGWIAAKAIAGATGSGMD